MINTQYILPLVNQKHQRLINDYMQFLRLGENNFLSGKRTVAVKLKQLQFLDKALRQNVRFKNGLIGRLQRAFVRENLSLSLLLDVLQGWRYIATIDTPISEKQYMEICGYILSPLARLIMVLSDENPSTYLPMSSLLVCLYQFECLEKNFSLPLRIKTSKRNKINKFNGLIKNSKVILYIINSRKLKYKLARLINELTLKIRKIEKNEQPSIGMLDDCWIFMYSVIQSLSIKKRTVCKKRNLNVISRRHR